MRKLTLIGSILLAALNIYGQINMADSTVQVIGYWDNNEKQLYEVTHEKFRVQSFDTTAREFLKYVVDVTIVDSSANSYTIDWFFHDYDFQTDNELLKKISSIAEDMTVTIRTNELGAIREVVNWKEIRDYIYKGTKMFKKETKEIPNMNKLIKQIESMYSSKESIEAAAIKEIRQFYIYHGGKYKLGEEINASMKVGNLYGDEPFDADITLSVDDINSDDNNSIIRMEQTVNSEQLTKTTFDYLTQMASTLQVPAPKWDEFPPLTNVTWTDSQIHGSGWIIYSVETKEASAEGALNVEERIIQLQ